MHLNDSIQGIPDDSTNIISIPFHNPISGPRRDYLIPSLMDRLVDHALEGIAKREYAKCSGLPDDLVE